MSTHALASGKLARLPELDKALLSASRAGDQLVVSWWSRSWTSIDTAAWLHDIGYAPIGNSRFHPIDGARLLQARGLPEAVVGLVAHHSGALVEAQERGLVDELLGFTAPPEDLLSRLTAADMTTSPDGALVTSRQRIAEILSRYEPGDPVHRAVARSGPSLIATTESVEATLSACRAGASHASGRSSWVKGELPT